MKLDEVVKRARELTRPYRVDDGKKFRLADVDPADIGHLKSEDKARAEQALQVGVAPLAGLQDRLYAQDQWSVLLIFQAMDAAGKDGAIKHVMSTMSRRARSSSCRTERQISYRFGPPASGPLPRARLPAVARCRP